MSQVAAPTAAAACPACGEYRLDLVDTGWRAITRYACGGCGYEHTIEHR